MKKIIIFGASGNVGSYLVRYAKSFFDPTEYEIIATGRRETNVFDSIGVKYLSIDITKEEDFEKLPKKDVQAVLLLAAAIPSYMYNYKPKNYLMTNTMGTFNALEYCRKVGADRILFTQTVFDISEYPQNQPLAPDLPPKFSYKGDHAMYVISKNTAIEMLKHYHAQYGLKYFIFRLPTIYCYSPYQYYFPSGVKKMRPVYQMIDRAIAGEPIELWGDPNYSKDMVHVYDFSQMLCRASLVENLSHGVYNVGTGMPVTLLEQIQTIIDVFSPEEKKSEIVFCPEKPCGGGFLMNIENAKKQLNYQPKYNCKALFEDFKSEMKVQRYKELRMHPEEHN